LVEARGCLEESALAASTTPRFLRASA
jgi:hypothetical protein